MVSKKIIYLYILIFPLGQIPGVFIQFLTLSSFRIHLTDIFVIFISLIVLFNVIFRKWNVHSWVSTSLLFTLFGIAVLLLNKLVNNSILEAAELLYGLRFIGYIMFAYYVFKLEFTLKEVTRILLFLSIVSGLIGLIQYALIPDLTWMKNLGWDDHYYRLVGSFLDPAFIGIILVFGILLSVWRKYYFISFILSAPLLLTYSRSSWLALLVGLLYLVFVNQSRKFIFAFILIFLTTVPFLPNPGGEGVNLIRTNSIEQKADNLAHSVSIIETSPLYGIGLNGICSTKSNLNIPTGLNSCSGLDNSLLFIFATTGLIGFFLYFNFIKETAVSTSKSYKNIIATLGLSLFIHSMFTNTLFYPWVLGYMALVIGSSRKSS